MSPSRIIRIVVVAFAVVAGVVTIPQSAVIIAVLGLIGGYFVPEDKRLSFMVMTLTLALVHGALTPIPAIGIYLTDILASVSSLLNAAACMVIVMHIVDRLKSEQ